MMMINKILSSIFVSLMFMGLIISEGIAQCVPIVSLDITKQNYIFNDPNDPFMATIIIQNVCTEDPEEDIIISAEFDDFLEFALRFKDDNGVVFLADDLFDPEPKGLKTALDAGGNPTPAAPVVILVPGDFITYEFPNVFAYYTLPPGHYEVIALIDGIIYAETIAEGFARFPNPQNPALAVGPWISGEYPINLVADLDGDGYSSPIAMSPPAGDPGNDPSFLIADCDDTNPDINPGMPEIPNGIDDDCKPATLDVAVDVEIDIKPGSDQNTINLGSKGTVPVAILSSDTFDATEVDPSTITLADAGVKVRGKGTAMYSEEDVNGDGLLDLVVHVETYALALTMGDTVATVEGFKPAGLGLPSFHISGVDFIRIVP